MHLLLERSPAQLQPHQEAGLYRVQQLRRGHHPSQGDDHGRAGAGQHRSRLDPHLLVQVEPGRLHLPVPVRLQAPARLPVALHREAGARQRLPQVHGPGSRRRREPEPVRLAILHRRPLRAGTEASCP